MSESMKRRQKEIIDWAASIIKSIWETEPNKSADMFDDVIKGALENVESATGKENIEFSRAMLDRLLEGDVRIVGYKFD